MNIRFEPYVGGKYQKSQFKLFILGESHYGNVERTSDIIEKYKNYKKGTERFEHWMNTFTKFTKAVCGENISNDKIVGFWDSIVFYNYVQDTVSNAGESPSEIQFMNGKEAFFKVLDDQDPTYIIAWGYRLWKYLPKENITLSQLSDNKHYLKAGNSKIQIRNVIHPCAPRFSLDYRTKLDLGIPKGWIDSI